MDKIKAIGSIYVNSVKDSTSETKDKVKKCVEFLSKNKAFFSITLKKIDVDNLDINDHGYVSVVGYFNGFKKSDKDKDAYIVPKTSQKSRPTYNKVATKAVEVDDSLPFE